MMLWNEGLPKVVDDVEYDSLTVYETHMVNCSIAKEFIETRLEAPANFKNVQKLVQCIEDIEQLSAH